MYDGYSSMAKVPWIPNAGGFEHNNISVKSQTTAPDDAASDSVCHGI